MLSHSWLSQCNPAEDSIIPFAHTGKFHLTRFYRQVYETSYLLRVIQVTSGRDLSHSAQSVAFSGVDDAGD
jgi:hypothetical protein